MTKFSKLFIFLFFTISCFVKKCIIEVSSPILIDLFEADIIDSTKVVPLLGTPKIKIGLKSF